MCCISKLLWQFIAFVALSAYVALHLLHYYYYYHQKSSVKNIRVKLRILYGDEISSSEMTNPQNNPLNLIKEEIHKPPRWSQGLGPYIILTSTIFYAGFFLWKCVFSSNVRTKKIKYDFYVWWGEGGFLFSLKKLTILIFFFRKVGTSKVNFI